MITYEKPFIVRFPDHQEWAVSERLELAANGFTVFLRDDHVLFVGTNDPEGVKECLQIGLRHLDLPDRAYRWLRTPWLN